MRRHVICLLLAPMAGCGDDPGLDLLIYTRTNGHRHGDSIDKASLVLSERLAVEGITFHMTEDPGEFLQGPLSRYRAVFFLYTSGNDILDPDGKSSLESFIRAGGGWAGLHSASDTEYEWPFYEQLVVAPFADHPGIQPAVVDVIDRGHPATATLPAGRWTATDEWYNFKRDPSTVTGVRILATLDETTYTGGTMGASHPVIWSHELLGGRAFYTELGHPPERWDEPAFLDHVIGGLRWILRKD